MNCCKQFLHITLVLFGRTLLQDGCYAVAVVDFGVQGGEQWKPGGIYSTLFSHFEVYTEIHR